MEEYEGKKLLQSIRFDTLQLINKQKEEDKKHNQYLSNDYISLKPGSFILYYNKLVTILYKEENPKFRKYFKSIENSKGYFIQSHINEDGKNFFCLKPDILNKTFIKDNEKHNNLINDVLINNENIFNIFKKIYNEKIKIIKSTYDFVEVVNDIILMDIIYNIEKIMDDNKKNDYYNKNQFETFNKKIVSNNFKINEKIIKIEEHNNNINDIINKKIEEHNNDINDIINKKIEENNNDINDIINTKIEEHNNDVNDIINTKIEENNNDINDIINKKIEEHIDIINNNILKIEDNSDIKNKILRIEEHNKDLEGHINYNILKLEEHNNVINNVNKKMDEYNNVLKLKDKNNKLFLFFKILVIVLFIFLI